MNGTAATAGSAQLRNELLAAAAGAARQGRGPYSTLKVGAALLSAAGNVYRGCNVENAAYPLGACAETAAIAAGVLAEGEAFRIVEAAVWALTEDGAQLPVSPCGGCRQRISELASGPDVLVHFCWPGTEPCSMRIDDLLPCAFALEGRGKLSAPASARSRRAAGRARSSRRR